MITQLTITPDYADGFSFAWEVDRAYSGTAVPVFTVQRGETHDGPWEDISPELSGVYAWSSTGKFVAPKDPVLYFRVRMVAGARTYSSSVIQPYGVLNKREFLLIRNIRRQELLQMRQMTGVQGCFYSKAIFGPVCTQCTDLVGGGSFSTSCSDCFGTGYTPGYHGPYCCWFVPSPAQRQKGMPGGPNVREDYSFQFRMLGTPPLKKDDIIVDAVQAKLYYVDAIVNVAEIRRVPIVQNVTVHEIPTSSPLYRLGSRVES